MKTKNLIKPGILLFGLFIFSASIVKAQTITEVIPTEGFTGINAGSIFKIEFTQDESWFIEIETEESNLDKVETSMKDGVLHLKFNGSTRNVNLKARIMSPELNFVKLAGTASLNTNNTIETGALTVNLSGAASATMDVSTTALETKISGASSLLISGVADHHTGSASGASQLKAQQLSTETTVIKVSGASHARVNASDYLDADASGTSRVTFDQEPASVEIKTAGMGSVNGTTASKVTGSAQGDTTRIRIGGRNMLFIQDDDSEKVKMQTGESKTFRSNWSGFEIGVNGYLTPDNNLTLSGDAEYIDLRYNKSVVVNLNLWQQNFPIISNNLGLVSGLGIGFNNYRFDNQTRIVYEKEGLSFYEDTIKDLIKNKMTVTWINLPLMLEFQTNGPRQTDKFHLAGGVILGTRIGTHTKYVTEENGKKQKEKDYHDFHVPPFRFDLTGRIGWGRVNLFATYALNNLFKDEKGPELIPFSVGIRLVDF
ncbi:MAG: GIN domain-containing protein [Bacteroidales bacterium]